MAALPPDGAPGQFIGFDADGHAYVLEWSEAEIAWLGVGIDPVHRGNFRLMPLAFIAAGERARFVVRHMPIPSEGI